MFGSNGQSYQRVAHLFLYQHQMPADKHCKIKLIQLLHRRCVPLWSEKSRADQPDVIDRTTSTCHIKTKGPVMKEGKKQIIKATSRMG